MKDAMLKPVVSLESAVVHAVSSAHVVSWITRGILVLFVPLLLLHVGEVHAENGHPSFAAGQEWSIKSDGPTTAKVIIDRIEGWRDQTVVHVSIIDIPSIAYKDSRPMINRIDHLPFEESALAASVDRLLLTGVAPPAFFAAGYKEWKDHNGGIYTITIAELLNTVLSH